METVGDPFESLTSCEAGKNVEEKGKRGRRNKARGISVPADYSSLFCLLGQALREGDGREGGVAVERGDAEDGGKRTLFLSLSITMAKEWAEYGRSGWAYLACDLRLLSTLLLSSFVLKSFLGLILLAEPQKRSPSNNSLVSSVAWFYF